MSGNRETVVWHKTVSWYLHSMNMSFDKVIIHNADSTRVVACTPGKALMEYGHFYVDYVVVNSECISFVLFGNFD